MKKVETAKERDRRKARARMRAIRAKGGGLSRSDRARNAAIAQLIRNHKAEFQALFNDAYVKFARKAK